MWMARMRAGISERDRQRALQTSDGPDARGYFTVEALKELDEFRLAFALAAEAIHVTVARVKGGKELERSGAFVFVPAQVRPPAARTTSRYGDVYLRAIS